MRQLVMIKINKDQTLTNTCIVFASITKAVGSILASPGIVTF